MASQSPTEEAFEASPKKIVFLRASNATTGGLEKFTGRLIETFAKRGFSCTLLTTGKVPKTTFKEALAKLQFREKFALSDTDSNFEKSPTPSSMSDFSKSESAPKSSNFSTKASFAKASKIVSLLSRKWFGSFITLLLFDYKVRRFLQKNRSEYIFGLDRNFVHQTMYRAGNGCHAAYLNHRKYFSSWVKRFLLRINPLHWLICAMEKKTFEETKILFVNSKLVKDEIVHYYPSVAPEKIHVIHNGVSWHELEKPFEEGFQKKRQIRQELHLSQEAYQFLFVGNEYRRKGLELLLEALATIQTPWELSVLGKERHLAYFKDKVTALNIADKVHFIGVASPVSWYQAADALVVPSYYDPFASVTVEALAMGLYVVSSPQNGGKEVLSHEEMGSVFTEYEVSKVALSLQKALQNPKTYEAALLRRRAVAYLDFSFVLQSYVDAVQRQ